MADKKLNSVSPVTDAAYVYAETSNGDTVKISKADLASVVAGLIPTATFTRKGLASVEMVNVLPKSTNTNNTNLYMEVFNHPVSFKGAFILISGFQDSTINESVSLVLCRSHSGLSTPTIIPLLGSGARLTIYGVLSGSKVRYCVHVPSAYMHIQSISLHPSGISLLEVVSDVSSWTRLV